VKEGGGELVFLRQLAALDLLPGLGPEWQIVAEPKIGCAERVQHPPSPPLDALGNRNGGRHRRESTYPCAS